MTRAEAQQPEGWIVTYVVEVVFDTNASRTGYDHVGTVICCTGCDERLDIDSSLAALARHARRHEPSVAPTGRTGSVPRNRHAARRPSWDASSPDRHHAVASLRGEEVTTEHTTT